MIPLKDLNPASRRPVVTVAVVLACAAVWFLVQQGQRGDDVVPIEPAGQQVVLPADLSFNLERAAVPCEVVQGEPLDLEEVRATFASGDDQACAGPRQSPELFPSKAIWGSVLVSMFLHGGLLHLGGNLLYLWIFGNNVEDRLGHVAFAAFYLVGGAVATLAHVAVNADSTVPLVGASGAIAAVMGAYAVWYPNARVRTIVPVFLVLFLEVRAKWLLGFWFVLQFFTGNEGGVAWVAHVGGFVFGVVAGLVLGPGRRRRPEPLPPVRRRRARAWGG
ncbi:MAG TPA: rhomboid family intramembrane serine protease [Aquihabitans sp.]|nr:rhomboid family intramembrane serine protease [Aquihabitans sp.]